MDIYVRSLRADELYRASLNSADVEGNDTCSNACIPADGCFIVFESYASNLAAGKENRRVEVFDCDLQQTTTTAVSVDQEGLPGNGTSARLKNRKTPIGQPLSFQ